VKGRKPKPTALKLLQGNPGKRPINRNEPQPRAKAPGCPTWLPAEGKAEWRRVVPELDRIGMLTKVDRAALAAYCAAWALLVRATRDVEANGLIAEAVDKEVETVDGVVHLIVRRTKNPAVLIARDAAAQVRQFCAEFGLTPSARSRMDLPDSGGGGDARERYLT
jgi:P27 family predicted phage terminase small subunit